ncbi:hypothetical protein [Nocardiopsis sp. LOL_012]|uniref:hypothetical protein n=1 Tax=Nocardiopsis sp. LOL_012 TaxID=3345409 RepID=UPI003A8A9324
MSETSRGAAVPRTAEESVRVPGPRPTPVTAFALLLDRVLLVREPDVTTQQWEDTQNCVMLAVRAAEKKNPAPVSAQAWGEDLGSILSRLCLWKKQENFSFSKLTGALPVILVGDVLRHLFQLTDRDAMPRWLDALFDPSGAASEEAFGAGSVLLGRVTSGRSGPAMELRALLADPAPRQNMLFVPVSPSEHTVCSGVARFEHMTKEYAEQRSGGSLREQVKTKLGEDAVQLTG